MNFTTLIMLIFTAILAIGLVSKGLNVQLVARRNYTSGGNKLVTVYVKNKR